MSAADFHIFRLKHVAWKTKLKGFLEGRDTMTEAQAISHRECSLGKWFYADGLNKYGVIPEMHKLEKVHTELHATVRKIISKKNQGDSMAAELEYEKIGPLSDEIVSLLTIIEAKVKSIGMI